MLKETKKWSANAIQSMCIANDYYTLGDNSSYSDMLQYVSETYPDMFNIYHVAWDIVQNSDLSAYGQSEEENIESVMFVIANDVVKTFYEITD